MQIAKLHDSDVIVMVTTTDGQLLDIDDYILEAKDSRSINQIIEHFQINRPEDYTYSTVMGCHPPEIEFPW